MARLAAQSSLWDATLLSPPPGSTVEAAFALDVEAELRRTASVGPPEPGDETFELRLNDQLVARTTDDQMVEGETLVLSARGLTVDNSPLVFGENVVTFTGTQLDSVVEAGRFQVIEQAATVTSLSFNKQQVSPGEFFRALVVYEGNREAAITRTLVINKVRRNADGDITDVTTVLADEVTVQPGTNEAEYAIQLHEMRETEELCAFMDPTSTDNGGT